MTFAGIWLLIIGIIYILKPDIFRRGIWLRTGLLETKLTPEAYVKFMRVLGALCIVAGAWILFMRR